jgi:nitrite reductase/ring-hydroxylating ferredoxin subunit
MSVKEDQMTTVASDRRLRAASLAELRAAGRQVVHLDGHVVCLFAEGEEVHAVDNRCPHMGFPLHRGTVCDGILTCHWHHARFDLSTGGTFDQFADELRRFPVSLDGDDVLVDLSPPPDPAAHQRKRLRDGLERDIALVVAKAAIALLESDPTGIELFRSGLDFGVARRSGGWFRGLTTLTCFANLVPHLDGPDRAAALYHGLADVAADSASDLPRFPLEPLPGEARRPAARLAAWFRSFVEVRDVEGAERALVSAVRVGASPQELADMLFAAATDHRYLDGGHTLDFVNKALEALDAVGWERAEAVLGSLPVQLAGAERMEESNAWRNPVDLVRLLEDAFAELPAALESVRGKRWDGRDTLVETLLEAEANAIAAALLDALGEGATEVELASAVALAAATRIARFPTSNEFGDWDTALHTFTFANAVEQGLRRSPSRELLRGVFDAAMSVHLDRFLNVPARRLPAPEPDADPETLLAELPSLLDRQQQVDEARQLAASFLGNGGEPSRLVAALGAALVREDRNFHTIQCVEAAARQHELLAGTPDALLPLVAAAGYLAAHATTNRSQRQTFEIARRLHRGEEIYEDEPGEELRSAG